MNKYSSGSLMIFFTSNVQAIPRPKRLRMRDLCKSSLLYFLSVTGPWDSRLLPYFVESSVGVFSALTSHCGYWNVLTIRSTHQPCTCLVIELFHQPRKSGAVRNIAYIFLLYSLNVFLEAKDSSKVLKEEALFYFVRVFLELYLNIVLCFPPRTQSSSTKCTLKNVILPVPTLLSFLFRTEWRYSRVQNLFWLSLGRNNSKLWKPVFLIWTLLCC